MTEASRVFLTRVPMDRVTYSVLRAAPASDNEEKHNAHGAG